MAGPTTLFQTGVHGSRPAASAGCVLYWCTTHNIMYRSDGSAWANFEDLSSFSGSGIPQTIADTKGDLLAATAADTWAKHPAPANGKTIVADSSQTDGWKDAYPPGYELDYKEQTGSPNVSITHTTEATADTVITSNSVTYDGTAIIVEFFAPGILSATDAASRVTALTLWEDSTVLGIIDQRKTSVLAIDTRASCLVRRKVTPAAGAHTYTVKATTSGGTATIACDVGGSGKNLPAYIRITKA